MKTNAIQVQSLISNNNLNPSKMKLKRTFESFEKFLRNIWKLQNNNRFVSEYNYKQYVKDISKILGFKEEFFLNAPISQLERWAKEMKTKPLFGKNPEKLRSNLNSGFTAFICYCQFQQELISF